MFGGTGLVFGILEMSPYPSTGSDMFTSVFATSVIVSENVQKYLGDSTYPIGSTILMQMMMQFSWSADVMT